MEAGAVGYFVVQRDSGTYWLDTLKVGGWGVGRLAAAGRRPARLRLCVRPPNRAAAR